MFSGDQPPPPLAKAKQLIQKGCWRLQVQMFQWKTESLICSQPTSNICLNCASAYKSLFYYFFFFTTVRYASIPLLKYCGSSEKTKWKCYKNGITWPCKHVLNLFILRHSITELLRLTFSSSYTDKCYLMPSGITSEMSSQHPSQSPQYLAVSKDLKLCSQMLLPFFCNII